MGMRLNIEIKKQGQDNILANCYYHWSAYTNSSIRLALEIIDNISSLRHKRSINTDTMKAVQLLQSTGGGLTEDDYNTLDEYEKKYCRIGQDRNLGLISITDKGIEETRLYEEGRITLDIDFDDESIDSLVSPKVSIDFGVYYTLLEEELKEEYCKDINVDELIEFDFDISNMNYGDLLAFASRIDEIENNYNGLFKIKGDELIYSCIY